jgi:predicted nucleic acid-binding protein
MRAVIDASAAVHVLSGQTASDTFAGFVDLHAPDHFAIECLSALRGMWRGKHLSLDGFDALSRAAIDLPVTIHSIALLRERIISLAANATSYDAAYIALAEGLDAPLLTADAKMLTVPGAQCEIVLVEGRRMGSTD